MKPHEFFFKYANTPLDKRHIVISFREFGMMTLYDVYKRVKELEDEMRPKRIEQDHLLDEVEKFL